MDPRGNNDAFNLFSSFWTDWNKQMAGLGLAPPPADARDEMMRTMRQAFFDAWGRYCEEFLGSEVFLDAMKKSMEGTLAFRQELNEFMTRLLHESQVPARSDTDSIMLVLHSLEERVIDRLDELSRRVANLEDVAEPSAGPGPKREQPAARKPKGAGR